MDLIYEIAIYVVGFLIVIWPASYITRKVTQRWAPVIEPVNDEGLPDAGRLIGILERILVLIFVLLNQYQAIGFLIAAKSILRFGEKDGDNRRKKTEYVLVGTLLSFTLAIAVGIAVRTAINLI